MLVYNNLVESGDGCDKEYMPIEPEPVSEVNNGGDDMVLNKASKQVSVEINGDIRGGIRTYSSSSFVSGISFLTFAANEYYHHSSTLLHSYVTINTVMTSTVQDY